MTYDEFLQSKICLSGQGGFFVEKSEINPMLKDFQRDIVQWDLYGGRRANFASFGLGKTFMQLECMRLVGKREGGRQLIIMPLGVRQEFKADAGKLGINLTFVRRTEEVDAPGIYITNYESVRDGRLDVNLFNAASLDEAAVLRSYGSKTYQTFLGLFSQVKYRFVNTATPSPNRYKELIHYAGYLGIMETGNALTRFFKRDSTKANNLTIHPGMEKEFWLWVSSWAIFLQRPSDLGYSDEGYDLPPLHVHEHMLESERRVFEEKDGQQLLLPSASLSLRAAAREKRDSIEIRTGKMVDIVKTHEGQFIVWCDLDNEQRAVEKALKAIGCSYVSLYGGTDIDKREEEILRWKNREVRAFVSKPVMYGAGINMQQCNAEIFLGIGFKFADFIQAIMRVYRFLQTRECDVHLLYMDSEVDVYKVLTRKWQQHKEMVNKMSEIIRKYGLSHTEMADELRRTIGVKRVEVKGPHYRVICNDCVAETRAMEGDSVDMVLTSIPFGNHYEYTSSYEDFGYNQTLKEFFEQMDYLTPELLRVLRPGRACACHVKDRIMFGNVTGNGFPTSDMFHCEVNTHMVKHGFRPMGMITIVTDVVRENNQTYRLGWSEQCKDGSKMGVGCPEYVLLYRKLQTDTSRGYADVPVTKSKDNYSRARWQVDAHGYWRSSGDRLLTAEEMANYGPAVLARVFTEYSTSHIYDYEHHVKIGEELDLKGCLPSSFMSLAPGSHHPDVWHDIVRMKTLNGEQTQRGLNNHICPLQIQVVDRLIERYTNPGDTVYDPFGGLMTVPYRAILKGRYGVGTELSPSYWLDGAKYCEAAEVKASMPTLFDFEEIEEGEPV